MSLVCFAYGLNRPGKRDGDEFKREAHLLAERRTGRVFVLMHKTYAELKAAFLQLVRDHVSDEIAIFCHGTRDGIQFLHKRNIADLVSAARGRLPTDRPTRIALYTCLAGASRKDPTHGDDSFADALRDALSFAGHDVVIYAHTTAGHTTRNPHVRVFRSPAGIGGFDLVSRRSVLWPKWVKMLQDPKSTLRFDFPWIEPEELLRQMQNEVVHARRKYP